MALGVLGTEAGQGQEQAAQQQQLQVQGSGFEGVKGPELNNTGIDSNTKDNLITLGIIDEATQKAIALELNELRTKLPAGTKVRLLNPESDTDNVGNVIPALFIVESDNLPVAINNTLATHPIIPVGAQSNGLNNFGGPGKTLPKDQESILNQLGWNDMTKGTIGLKAITHTEGTLNLSNEEAIKYANLPTNKIHIFEQEGKIFVRAGVGVTVDQINEELSTQYPGRNIRIDLDLTTRGTAHMSGVFAAGAQGPNRIRPHEVVTAINIVNGIQKKPITITEKDQIRNHSGMLGTTGIITEITLEATELPRNQFGILLPINIAEVGDLMAKLNAAKNNNTIISGIEFIAKKDTKFTITENGINLISPDNRGTKKIADAFLASGKENLLYITGYTNGDPESVQISILQTLAGITPENDDFSNQIYNEAQLVTTTDEADNIAAFRENIPLTARQLANKLAREKGKQTFSLSTDFNTSFGPEILQDPANLAKAYQEVINGYLGYISECQKLANESEGTTIHDYFYGHGNPKMVNPHTRIVAATDTAEKLKQITAEIHKLQEALRIKLQKIAGVKLEPGEKTVFEGYDLLANEEQIARAQLVQATHPNLRDIRIGKVTGPTFQSVFAALSPTNQPSPAVVN
jgi:hypothetical protein